MEQYHESILNKEFFDRSPETVARDLLGKYIIRRIGQNILAGKIVETEAYLASGDEASHNFKGMNNRNKSLYKDAGHAYIHSMRQWDLLDIVTESEHVPSSVLIRAVEPVEGYELMRKFRKTDDDGNLTNGPGKFCQAFDITRESDGMDIANPDSPIVICEAKAIAENLIGISGRVGISKASEMPLRFWIRNNPYASR